MIEDINEPLGRYQSTFKDEHARHTSELFESLLAKSGVDEAANAETVRLLRVLESEVAATKSSSRWWQAGRIVAWIAGAVSLMMAFTQSSVGWLVFGILGALACGALVFYKLNPMVAEAKAKLVELEQRRDEQLKIAWQQTAPLNRLYRWEFLASLFQKTVPRIELDPYFSNGRLDELRDSFDWSDSFNEDRSILFAHSGVLNGNPFVIARTLRHWIGTKTYHGTKQISWTERVRTSQGKWTTVRRHQTLHASVTKPFPEYEDTPAVVYGNEAAPDLSFTRTPSSLSGLEDGLISNWRKRRAVKALEARARNLQDGGGFTVMANTEFDALFGATDRDHEVQFRLLFTPLAQQEMLKLLKDKEAGFGDAFSFLKQNRLNVVVPTHLEGTDISGDPANFHHYEVAYARTHFNTYYNELFRALYFGLAPLLAIPLYQQHRSHADIYRNLSTRQSNFWEHESIANYFGEGRFAHPDCVTRSLLKTETKSTDDGVQKIRVTAHGYRGKDRVDYVRVHGGDGKTHSVPVHWVEYFEVKRNSDIALTELPPGPDSSDAANQAAKPSWHTAFEKRGLDPGKAMLRRSIAALLLA